MDGTTWEVRLERWARLVVKAGSAGQGCSLKTGRPANEKQGVAERQTWESLTGETQRFAAAQELETAAAQDQMLAGPPPGNHQPLVQPLMENQE